jgi:hypothetical protein
MNSSLGRNEGGSIYHEGVKNTISKVEVEDTL